MAIEHGHHNTINANAFEKNRDGVQLWVNLDAQRGAALFRQCFPDSAESHDTAIQDNTFTRHDHAIRCWSARG